ncbi:hypothetical protein FMEXI_319, partial [Fusarium mexicanum]
MESYKSLISFFLIFTHFAHLAQAVEYMWVFTYGNHDSNVVCHAGFSVLINNHAPYHSPSARLLWVECASNGDTPDHSTTVVLPSSGPQAPHIYIMTLDPHSSRGDVGFEVGIDQPAFHFADGTIPVMNPRINITQNYNVAEKPEVTGTSNNNVWTNVYQPSEGCPDGGQTKFEIWKTYYGIVGSWRGSPKEGTKAQIAQTKPVTLGSQSDDGSQNSGTTLNTVVVGGRSISFDRSPAPQSEFVNAFEIDTGNDFTLQTATE